MKGSKFSVPLKGTNTNKTSSHAAVPAAYGQQQKAVARAVSRAIHAKPKRCK